MPTPTMLNSPWLDILKSVFAKYCKREKDLPLPKVPDLKKAVKHAVKAAGRQGLPGTKQQRQAAFEAFLQIAKSSKIVKVKHGRVRLLQQQAQPRQRKEAPPVAPQPPSQATQSHSAAAEAPQAAPASNKRMAPSPLPKEKLQHTRVRPSVYLKHPQTDGCPDEALQLCGSTSQAHGSAGQASGAAGLPAIPSPRQAWEEDQMRTNVKRGAFTKAEDDALRAAAEAFAEEHGLSRDLSWLFGGRSDLNKLRSKHGGTWKTIAQALPHRTLLSVWARGMRILHPNHYKGAWSKEEDDMLIDLVQQKGKRWREIADLMQRHPYACRDRYREEQMRDTKRTGKWSAEETAKLKGLVDEYLAAKQAVEEARNEAMLSVEDITTAPARVSRRLVLDDVAWEQIALRHGTRGRAQCVEKWYTQLAPSMIAKGDWGPGDDRRLLQSIWQSGAANDWEVDWGSLVKGRSAEAARRRWRLMLKCVPDLREKDFREIVEFLVKKFLPNLLEQHDAGHSGAEPSEQHIGGPESAAPHSQPETDGMQPILLVGQPVR